MSRGIWQNRLQEKMSDMGTFNYYAITKCSKSGSPSPLVCTSSILAATSPLERSELNLNLPPTTITTNNQFPERFPNSPEYKSYKLLGMVCEFRF